MATGVSVPPEMIEEILKRLPAKALGRFKCLSKKWKTLISSVRFINNHIEFSTRLSREKLILLLYGDRLYTVDLVDLKKDNVSELMATEVRDVPWPRGSEFDGSCNGLIVTTILDVVHEDTTMLLVNPTTGEFTEVVEPPPPLPKGHRLVRMEVWGFGYDSSTDDYKFVSIIHCSVENVKGKPVRLVVVRSLKSNRPKMDIKPPDYTNCGDLKAVYLNGCIHWLCECDRGPLSPFFIAVFNLQNEEFEVMEVPEFENVSELKLAVVSGCLCVVTTIRDDSDDECADDDFSMEIWVMKEYGVTESWNKIAIDGLDTSDIKPLYLLGDREVVLKVVRVKQELVVYNEGKDTREVTISGVPTTSLHIEGTCVESLVSPKYVCTA